MNTSHPNRPHKRRGDKLVGWTHNCYPMTLKEKIEVKQQLDDTSKVIKKPTTKKKEYIVWTKWGFRDYNKRLWHRHGKYLKLNDANKAYDGIIDNCSLMRTKDGKPIYFYSDIKLEFKGDILKEFHRD